MHVYVCFLCATSLRIAELLTWGECAALNVFIVNSLLLYIERTTIFWKLYHKSQPTKIAFSRSLLISSGLAIVLTLLHAGEQPAYDY